jgi:hypothetical protein
MPTKFKVFAIAAVLAAGTSSAAMGCSNPVSSTVSGEAAGAANGWPEGCWFYPRTGGARPGAPGSGTANMLSGGSTPPPAPACGPGYTYLKGYCYPRL